MLGDRCIVKVRAPAGVLTALASQPGIKRLPKDRLDDSLSDLPPAIKQALRDEALDMGYTLAEIQARFPNDLGTYTLRDVVHFMATRRLKSRWTGIAIVLDGIIQSCKPVAQVDAEVSDD